MKWVNGNVPIIQWELIGWHWNLIDIFIAGIFQLVYLFKVNNRNTRKRCEICSELIIKTLERRHKMVKHTQTIRRQFVVIVNFEQISHLFSVSIVDFKQVNSGWD